MGQAVSVARVYLDTNLFISAFEGPGAVSDHAWWILEAVERGELHGITSELTLAEVLVHPLRRGDRALEEAYEGAITASDVFTVVPVDRSILRQAARLRGEHGSLRLPDAVHLASALSADADWLVTRDARFAGISPIRVVDGGPHTLDRINEAQT